MTITNSIYASTPIKVADGGTGNSTALTNGQLWIGRTGNTPVAGSIQTPFGSGLSIINGSGTITIDTNGLTFIWNDTGTGTSTNMTGNNGYLTAATNPVFFTSASANVGDIYRIVGYSVPAGPSNNGFSITVVFSQSIFYNGFTGTTISTSVAGASFTLVCSGGSALFQTFSIVSNNGASFTLS